MEGTSNAKQYPYVVYDYQTTDWVPFLDDPDEQLGEVNVIFQVSHRSGRQAMETAGKLLEHLDRVSLLMRPNSMRTLSDDFTATGDGRRGVVRCLLNVSIRAV